MEVIEVEDYHDLLDASKGNKGEANNPQKKTEIVLKKDILIKSEISFNNAIIKSQGGVKNLEYEKISGSNIVIEKIHLTQREEDKYDFKFGESYDNSLSVDGLLIRKSFFDDITILECGFIDMISCAGKRIDIVNSSNVSLEDVVLSKGLWEEKPALKIDNCEDVEVSELESKYDEDEEALSCVSVFESSNVSIEESSIDGSIQAIYFEDSVDVSLKKSTIKNCKKALSVRGSEVFVDSVDLNDNQEPVKSEDIKTSEIEVEDTPEIIAAII